MTDLEYLKKYGEYTKENIEKVNSGYPVQYVCGNVYFYNSLIDVDENTLIPRFETEELVSYTIKKIKDKFNNKINVIDLGTGSGCIAISIKKEINCDMEACDISSKALEVAKRNALNNNVEIDFINKDMLLCNDKKFDVIISNPPYIAHDEKIEEKVYKYEPHSALYASNNGLYFYEEILKRYSNCLKDNFLIAFEIGYKQADSIKELVCKYLPNSNFTVIKDMSLKDRIVFIENK